jgi:hypothetical protein
MVNVFTAGLRNLGIMYQMVSHPLANLLTLSGQFSLAVSEALFVKRLKPCKLFVVIWRNVQVTVLVLNSKLLTTQKNTAIEQQGRSD